MPDHALWASKKQQITNAPSKCALLSGHGRSQLQARHSRARNSYNSLSQAHTFGCPVRHRDPFEYQGSWTDLIHFTVTFTGYELCCHPNTWDFATMGRDQFLEHVHNMGQLRYDLDDPEEKVYIIEHYEKKKKELDKILEYFDFEERRQAGLIERLDDERYLRDTIGFVFVDEDQRMAGQD